jgi:hypothetical protein
LPWLPVYTCGEARCGTKYCPDDGPSRPVGGSTTRERHDQVHPWVVPVRAGVARYIGPEPFKQKIVFTTVGVS